MSALTLRFASLPAEDLAAGLRLERGTPLDYAALAPHHYRAARPATATRVLVLRHAAPTVVGRWLGRRAETRVAAVLVESRPLLSCRLRDVALGGRYGPGLSPCERARVLNREVRCISRVVVDPRWRGLGLAVRLVRAALDDPATPVTEALAAMGGVHPFFERAGMTRYDRPHHAHDARLVDALARVGISPGDLASARRAAARWGGLDAAARAWLGQELRRWAQRSRAGPRAGGDPEMLARAGARLMCLPVYFVHVHEPKEDRDGDA